MERIIDIEEPVFQWNWCTVEASTKTGEYLDACLNLLFEQGLLSHRQVNSKDKEDRLTCQDEVWFLLRFSYYAKPIKFRPPSKNRSTLDHLHMRSRKAIWRLFRIIVHAVVLTSL